MNMILLVLNSPESNWNFDSVQKAGMTVMSNRNLVTNPREGM